MFPDKDFDALSSTVSFSRPTRLLSMEGILHRLSVKRLHQDEIDLKRYMTPNYRLQIYLVLQNLVLI